MRPSHDCDRLGIMNCALCSAELYEDGEVAVVEFQWPAHSHSDWLADRASGKRPSSRVFEIGLNSVRAADSIRIYYDFKRDGYVITQASKFTFDADEPFDMDYQEVAFVQAWARERPDRGATG